MKIKTSVSLVLTLCMWGQMFSLDENWQMSSSLNRHMYRDIDNWFYRYITENISMPTTDMIIYVRQPKGITCRSLTTANKCAEKTAMQV